MICNNTAQISGVVKSRQIGLKFECTEAVSAAVVDVERASGTTDEILVIAEDDQLGSVQEGDYVLVDGCVRISRLQGGRRIVVFVLALKTEVLKYHEKRDINVITVQGQLGTTRYKKLTSHRKILVNCVLTVPGFYKNRNAMLPCLFWGSVGDDVYSLPYNTWVKAEGRLQSREYLKDMSDGFEKVIVREFSICSAVWDG